MGCFTRLLFVLVRKVIQSDQGMRVCVLVENHFRGGVANVLSTILRGHFDEPFEFTLVTNSNNPMLESLIVGDNGPTNIVPFRFKSTSEWFAGTVPWSVHNRVIILLDSFRKFLKPFLLLHQVIYFTRLFKTENFDALLNVNGGYPGSISSRAAALGWSRGGSPGRQVMAIHNYASPSRIGFRLIDRWIDRAVVSGVDEVVTVSNSCKLSFANRPSLQLHQKITVIPNGVETHQRKDHMREETRKSLNIDDKQTVVLMLGTYEPRKGHEFLLQSFAELQNLNPSARLICAGDDPNQMIKQLQKRVRQLGLVGLVTLMPFQSDISRLMEACDIVAIPSQSYESFCLVAVEAFKYAKPIVGTNTGAIPEIAPQGMGSILCEPENKIEFSQALYRLSTDREMYHKFSELSGLRFINFGVPEMMLRYQRCLIGI